jgi:hypothetical protein
VKILFAKTGIFFNMSDKESRSIWTLCSLIEGLVDVGEKRKQKRKYSSHIVKKIVTNRVDPNDSKLKKTLKKKQKVETSSSPLINHIFLPVVNEIVKSTEIKSQKDQLEAFEIKKIMEFISQNDQNSNVPPEITTTNTSLDPTTHPINESVDLNDSTVDIKSTLDNIKNLLLKDTEKKLNNSIILKKLNKEKDSDEDKQIKRNQNINEEEPIIKSNHIPTEGK